MTTTHKEVARTIISQIGNYALNWVGAYDLLIVDDPETAGGLTFGVGSRPTKSYMKKIRITYQRGLDLYTVQGYKFNRLTLEGLEPVVTFDQVYAEQLPELVQSVARTLGVRC
jgi:hypothetical protein